MQIKLIKKEVNMSCFGKGKGEKKTKEMEEGQQSDPINPRDILLRMESGEISNMNRTSIIGWIAAGRKPKTSDPFPLGKRAKPYP
ncbi:MAG TPA: hypothetical protein PKM84_01900 [Candidatus Pacearchaeota archaeon]|nr:hypothetical protein [Candidatus Pacearchaeota archaeon]